jgi:hypothetical protein
MSPTRRCSRATGTTQASGHASLSQSMCASSTARRWCLRPPPLVSGLGCRDGRGTAGRKAWLSNGAGCPLDSAAGVAVV